MRNEISAARIVRPADTLAAFDDEVELAGRVDVPVLITGGSCWHRQLCAKTIHHCRSGGALPFVTVPARCVNAAHRDAAYATLVLPGSIRTSDAASRLRGTLFIDDIAELTTTGQEWLSVFLGACRAASDSSSGRDGARIIAGSSAHLMRELSSGEFSERLFYRLNIIHVELT